MKICRFRERDSSEIKVGAALEDGNVKDLSEAGVANLETIFESDDPRARAQAAFERSRRVLAAADVRFAAPVERQEVWAAGVTYLRSKKARMEESDFSASAYDRVYEAVRPEIFFKALPHKVVASGERVGIRRDAKWNVPEPELALVLNSRGKVVGCTIGNDMSSRDIEGENLLYLPQAKVYDGSCALGPWITLGATEAEARTWHIRLNIARGGATVFEGETSAGNLKRSFPELAEFLFRSQSFVGGAVLLTGTGIVPPDHFTLAVGDVVTIEIDGIGQLRNAVAVV